MCAPLGDPGGQGKQGLRAVQRLDLALLVDAQHHGHQWRVHVQPDDVAHLLDKQRVARQLEGLLPMGLQSEGAPDARHRRLRQAGFARHGARAPVRCSGGHTLQRLGDHSVHARVVDRCAVRQVEGHRAIRPADAHESGTPLRTVCGVTRCRLATALLSTPSATGQNNARPQRQRSRGSRAVVRNRMRCPPQRGSTHHRRRPRPFKDRSPAQ